MKENPATAIRQTQKWLLESVIKYQFCPYAKPPYEQDIIGYYVYADHDILTLLETLALCCIELDNHEAKTLETTLLIIADTELTATGKGYLSDFYEYLDALDIANDFLANPKQFSPYFSATFRSKHTEGIPETWNNAYQLASFHPDYQFENTTDDDRGNYTNRSPYPIFHIIRNASIEQVRINDEQASKVVQHNITTLQNLSVEAFQLLQDLAKPK